MLLAIDAGNSNILLGVFKGDTLLYNWRLLTEVEKTGDEYGILFQNMYRSVNLSTEETEAIIISCVIPPLVSTFEELCQKYFHLTPLIVGPGVKTGIPIHYDNPREVGADRIVNPGIMISSEALFQRASKLPRVELLKPEAVIGKNTVASMQSGIVYGYVGLIDGIVNRMKEEMGDDPFVVATGGLAQFIAAESETIDEVDEYLTLKGLRIIYSKNK